MKIQNEIYLGASNRASLIDLEIPEKFNGKLLLFIHGFMGFKDWGCWPLMQEYFTELGFGFCKFNFSHNGGTIDQAYDFPDEDAFAKNTYSKELVDVYCVLDWIEKKYDNIIEIILVGHSRGGGIVALLNHTKVRKKVFLAAVSSFENRFPKGKELEEWLSKGYRTIFNSRTKQYLNQNIEIWEDFNSNKEELSIKNSCLNDSALSLVIHGSMDESVNIDEGRKLAEWKNCNIMEIENANHTFGAHHPWQGEQLPNQLRQVCDAIFEFIS